MVTSGPTLIDAANAYLESLPIDRRGNAQEPLRLARWLGPDRPAAQIRPPDIEEYSLSFATAPNASTRAESLKAFLAFAHKQKLMPERLVSHVRVRRATTRNGGGPAHAAQRREVHLTTEGKEALVSELESLKARRPKIAEELRLAMADKDFRENAPLDAARDAQGQMEARIRELEATLHHAVTIEESAVAAAGAARVGSTIVLQNLGSGTTISYTLVSSQESRAATAGLSVESPVGAAVLGKRAGEEVEVQAPSGKIRMRLESVTN
jgi:transcription elongation factor GreA